VGQARGLRPAHSPVSAYLWNPGRAEQPGAGAGARPTTNSSTNF